MNLSVANNAPPCDTSVSFSVSLAMKLHPGGRVWYRQTRADFYRPVSRESYRRSTVANATDNTLEAATTAVKNIVVRSYVGHVSLCAAVKLLFARSVFSLSRARAFSWWILFRVGCVFLSTSSENAFLPELSLVNIALYYYVIFVKNKYDDV